MTTASFNPISLGGSWIVWRNYCEAKLSSMLVAENVLVNGGTEYDVSQFTSAHSLRCLDNLLTAGASHARTDEPVHHEPSGDIFQFLGDVLAQGLELATAFATRFAGRQQGED